MMDCIVQWATILSPIIAVGLAWWAVRSSSKDTDRKIAAMNDGTSKQIAAMRENAEKEVNQLKELAQLEVEALTLKLDMELIQRQLMAQQAEEERKGMEQIMNIPHLTFQELGKRDFESKQPERNLKYTKAFIQELKKLSERLEGLKKQLYYE